MSSDEKLIAMKVKGLMVDPSSNVPIVMLRSEEEGHFLPIWIGIFEANAIALKLEDIQAPRPMTHDLIASLLSDLEAQVQRVIINNLHENTFFAQIVLHCNGREQIVDARPSDAIAVALRVEAPILVAESVLEKARGDALTEHLRDEEKLKKWLEEVDPDDLGKYTM